MKYLVLLLLIMIMGCSQDKSILLNSDSNNNSFLDLNDTPNTYGGSGNFFVTVNGSETGLIFSSPADFNASVTDTTLDTNSSANTHWLDTDKNFTANIGFTEPSSSRTPATSSLFILPSAVTNDSIEFWIGKGVTQTQLFSVDEDGDVNVGLGQLSVEIATGTSPLIINSQTKVDNLNVDLLDGLSVGISSSALCNISTNCTWSGRQIFTNDQNFLNKINIGKDLNANGDVNGGRLITHANQICNDSNCYTLPDLNANTSGNFVTIDTNQLITGSKTFTNDISFSNDVNVLSGTILGKDVNLSRVLVTPKIEMGTFIEPSTSNRFSNYLSSSDIGTQLLSYNFLSNTGLTGTKISSFIGQESSASAGATNVNQGLEVDTSKKGANDTRKSVV